MLSYQLRDTATRQLLAWGLADYAAAEAAADRLDNKLERDLAANGEGAGRIRLRLDVEKVTASSTEVVGHHVLLLGVDNSTEPAGLGRSNAPAGSPAGAHGVKRFFKFTRAREDGSRPASVQPFCAPVTTSETSTTGPSAPRTKPRPSMPTSPPSESSTSR